MLSLADNLYETTSTKGKKYEIWKRAYAICNLHSCDNLALVL